MDRSLFGLRQPHLLFYTQLTVSRAHLPSAHYGPRHFVRTNASVGRELFRPRVTLMFYCQVWGPLSKLWL